MKRVVSYVVAGILVLLVVVPGLSRPRRVWDWESILLSGNDNVFAATYYKVSLGGSVPINLGEDIENVIDDAIGTLGDVAEEVGEVIVEVADVVIDWLEDKVEEYQLGPALSVFIPGPGLNFTTD